MTLAALASTSDLGALLGASIDDSDARAVLVLRMASGQVRDAAGLTWETGGVPEVAWTVTLAAAARGYSNPTGADDLKTGPFAASFSAGVLLTDEERERVAALNPSTPPGLSSVRVKAPWGASGTHYPGYQYDQMDESGGEFLEGDTGS